MKTRKIWLCLAALAGLLMPGLLRAQNVGININAGQAFILNGNQGVLDVQVCNSDPLGQSTPANAITPLVSFPINLTILSVTNVDGTPLAAADYDVLYVSNNDAEGSHDVKVRIKKPLEAFGACALYRIHLQGNAVGTGAILGTLLFEQLLQSNSPLDDNSESTIPVMVNLPVKLKSFDAKKVENSAVVNWSTTEEINSDRFEVQRSRNGKEWSTIQTVQSAGESNSLQAYEALDRESMSGENLYRLKMIDSDGSTAFSAVKSLKFDVAGMVVYPNPVVDFLHLSAAEWDKVEAVSIHDVAGRAVYQSGDKPESSINVSKFVAGVYHVRVKKSDGTESNYRIAVAK